jgi:hemerythrin-like domain-containing protein
MLTATYSLVAIAAEQDKTRTMLSRLQQYLQATWRGLQNIDFSFLETTFGKLMQFEKYFGARKLERFLVPALRGADREAESLVAELDALRVKSANILRSLGDQLAAAFEMSSVKINQICHAMESYCGYMLVRLEREERELIPLARRLFSIEDWFKIAAQFLSDDGDGEGRAGKHGWQRRGRVQGQPNTFVRS